MPDYTALEIAAREAIAYRARVAIAEHTPCADYATILRALEAPLPERGDDGAAIIRELVERATPGIRAMTGPRSTSSIDSLTVSLLTDAGPPRRGRRSGAGPRG